MSENKVIRFSDEYFKTIATRYATWLYSDIPEVKDITEPHIFTQDFLDYIAELANRLDKPKKISKTTKRIIALIAAIIAIIFAALSVGAVREALYRFFFIEKSDIHAVVQYQSEDSQNESEFVTYSEIETFFEPTYIVDGFNPIKKMESPIFYSITYSNDNKDEYKFTQYPASNPIDFDYDDFKQEVYTINNIEIYVIFYNNNDLLAIWNEKGYTFTISGKVTKDEIEKIIDSINTNYMP